MTPITDSNLDLDQVLDAAETNSAPTPRTLAQKLAVFAGGGAVASAIIASPSVADADIVQSLTAPISPPAAAGSNFWDVDGDLTFDFELRNSGATQASFDDQIGGRLVVPFAQTNDGIAKLVSGLTIGTGLGAPYKFHTLPQGGNGITGYSSIAGDATNGGWTFGDTGFFGFKFTKFSGTHFGWGEMTIGPADGTPGDNFIITRAYYNDTADAPINVGAVPEPSSVALLALGAAGLAMWRRRRKEANS